MYNTSALRNNHICTEARTRYGNIFIAKLVLICYILSISSLILMLFIFHDSFRSTHLISANQPSRNKFSSRTNFIMDVDTVKSSMVENNVNVNSTVKEAKNVVCNDSCLQMNSNAIDVPLCPDVPPMMHGLLATYNDSPLFEDLEKMFPKLESGGRFQPKDCVSRHRVAIIIPYRDREEQLRSLLHNLHALLQRQQLDYGIVVVEQAPPAKFNRAMLMNIGFSEAIKIYDYKCFIFHDVDLVPQNDKQIYNCFSQPRHLSAAIDKFSYELPYSTLFGGVSALTKEQFLKVNGFSNIYFGWGGEDDDMYLRLFNKGYVVIRYPLDIARYRMIKHNLDKGNEESSQRWSFPQNVYRSERDGLNTLQYKLLHQEKKKLFTWVHVNINETEIMQNWKRIG